MPEPAADRIPDVSVVVVTYNSGHVVTECLEPLVGAAGIEVIVWDNASADHTPDLVATRFPGVQVVRGDENLGFAKAVNRAARLASGRHLLLLNPDAVVEAEELRRLVGALDHDPSIGIAAPRIRQPAATLKVLEVGRRPTVWRMLTHWSGLSRLSGLSPALEGFYLLAAPDVCARDVDWASGACLLIRGDAWSDLQGMTERWFMYAEDVELCLRAVDAGWRVRFEPSVNATHALGGSSSPESTASPARVDWVVNLYDLYCTAVSRGPVSRWLWKFVVVAGLFSRSAACAVKARSSDRAGQDRWRRESRRFAQFASALRSTRPARWDEHYA